MKRTGLTRLLAVVAVLSIASVSPGQAQVLPYKFVKIADTVANPDAHIDGLHCVGLNNAGMVVIKNSQNALWRGNAVTGGTIRLSPLQRPLINNAGRIAFIGRLDPPGTTGPHGVYTSTDGVNLAQATPSVIGDRFSLNNAGHVAYRSTFASPRTGVYLGRPGAIAQAVAPENGSIDGTTLHDAFIWEESLNDLGQIAFWAFLADGREAVYRADPQWLKTLTFTNRIPGCGPVRAKLTLNAPAPSGGLSVTLSSGNPAASVPAAIVVPAGKTTATFNITPAAVLANTAGTIEATVGPQSLERTLTVRPIGVKAVALTPNPVTGGTGVTGTATLECGAAPSAIVVALSSSKPAAAQPAVPSLTFPAGTASLPFAVTTTAVTASTSATIKASANGTKKSKKLIINP